MSTCPKCNEQMPLLSKVCPTCGYIRSSDDSELSANEIAQGIEKGLIELKSIPIPTFSFALKSIWFIPVSILAISMIIMAVISQSGLFIILSVLFSTWSLILIIKAINKKTAYHKNEQLFNTTLNSMEYLGRVALRNYPNESEIKTLIRNTDKEVLALQNQRQQTFRHGIVICWIVILTLSIAVAYTLWVANEAVNETPQTEQTTQTE